ncbi:hypothetical protein DTO013E5_1074 [Penicillium roqueforti]|uniref:Genomic scaffold, ProqFM164S01 n=1 Tax=Penicillium roqueforti (strain FM164) TaxID=1365484 RepID=W6Q2M4_PENRF|nr:uncharacterized protein LCP9604111_1899 [Penicillium roqueforti]CDM28464.1 unnamed protein product [Penicillium roqueforti FM164]KAF9251903.1 hypothetical protein LCP9604111_1899 [Penicillium roqueforti]KAI1836283.1 hypothetical protein CBS147337_2510 [Penicillium roqueforti]KAI2687609.1 hypothetical protein LCP963914a_3127 [Penicillium roqueforti]KAI2690041.1 hypothetical protein CBS147355_492 [Penicillium roqueforti]
MNTSISKPAVSPTGPSGTFMVELLIYNGSPFKNHWAYFVRSHEDPDIGVKIHATGNVRSGFEFEIKRSENLQITDDIPSTRVPLQWVDADYFDEKAMLNDGEYKIDNAPVCLFEKSAYEVKAPGKTLNSISDGPKPGRKVIQRDCQTWIVESADQLHRDNILSIEVVTYLHAIKQ